MLNNDNQMNMFAEEGESEISLFKKKEIRKVLSGGEWWFSVKDVVEALVDTKNGIDYIGKLRKRDEGFDERYRQIVETLYFESEGGKQKTHFVNMEGIFRIVQSVPTKKAEPFKTWLAKVGFERIQELENPDIAIKRAMAIYRAKGYDDAWIESRINNKASREKLEAEWNERGINESFQYGILTNAISEATFDISIKQHKEIKGLKSQSLRDNMTPLELTLTTLGEQATAQIARARDVQGFEQNKEAAKLGGQVAGSARKDIESVTNESIVSSRNYKDKQARKENALLDGSFDLEIEEVASVSSKKNLPKK